MQLILNDAVTWIKRLPVISWLIEAGEEYDSEWRAWEKPTGRFLETRFVMRRKVRGAWVYRECTEQEEEEASWDRTEKNAGW